MNKKQRSELAGILSKGGVLFDCPMERHTTFRVGGKAEAVCYPSELHSLRQAVSYLHESGIQCLIVGKGSNLLVKDCGIKGVVMILAGNLASVEKLDDKDDTISAGGGLTITKLLSYCGLENLAGLEFLAGIPGTVGGAVFMNAGAFGKEIGMAVKEICVVTRSGEVSVVPRSQLKFSYRRSSVQEGNIIYGVKFKLRKERKDKVNGKIVEYLKKKRGSQPLDLPSAGSVFRNPPGDYAGRLIEKAGLKGKRIGGAMISPKHANFIVNTGGARADDILALMNLARDKVKEESGIDLEPEIKIVGL